MVISRGFRFVQNTFFKEKNYNSDRCARLRCDWTRFNPSLQFHRHRVASETKKKKKKQQKKNRKILRFVTFVRTRMKLLNRFCRLCSLFRQADQFILHNHVEYLLPEQNDSDENKFNYLISIFIRHSLRFAFFFSPHKIRSFWSSCACVCGFVVAHRKTTKTKHSLNCLGFDWK